MTQGGERHKEYLYRCFVEQNHGYAIIFFDEAGHITNWNHGAERIFGWTADEAVGHPNAMIFTPEDREQHVPEREMRAAREDGITEDDRWHLRKDGSRIWVNGLMTAIHNDQGELLGYAKVVRDETKKQEMQETLHRTSGE